MIRNTIYILLIAAWSISAVARDYSYHARVEGMVCAFCAYGVNKKISALPGVLAESVDVDLKQGAVVFRADRPVSQDAAAAIFSDSGFKVSDLRETAVPPAPAPRPSRLALDLKVDGLDATAIASLLEEVGKLAASRVSGVVIHAPAASEPDLLKPVLMGRQQVMKVRYVPVADKSIRLQLYLPAE